MTTADALAAWDKDADEFENTLKPLEGKRAEREKLRAELVSPPDLDASSPADLAGLHERLAKLGESHGRWMRLLGDLSLSTTTILGCIQAVSTLRSRLSMIGMRMIGGPDAAAVLKEYREYAERMKRLQALEARTAGLLK